MTLNKAKLLIAKYWIFYFIGFIAVLGIKYFYSKAGSNELEWILTPTARWVRILSGIPFEWEPHIGYVNHSYRFIIASSCSGVQFMMITIAMLIYTFVHRMKTMGKGFCWVALSLGASYLFTIFVNGFRILLSIYLPLYLQRTDIYPGWLTPERLHTIIGIVIYFSSLLAIYHLAGYASLKITDMPGRNSERINVKYSSNSFTQVIYKCIPPTFWYFSIALGVPFLNKAYQNGHEKFTEYALLMTAVCLNIILVFSLTSVIRKHVGKQKCP